MIANFLKIRYLYYTIPRQLSAQLKTPAIKWFLEAAEQGIKKANDHLKNMSQKHLMSKKHLV